jgi:hypothetical protein
MHLQQRNGSARRHASTAEHLTCTAPHAREEGMHPTHVRWRRSDGTMAIRIVRALAASTADYPHQRSQYTPRHAGIKPADQKRHSVINL